MIDSFIHGELLFVNLPLLFPRPGLRRRGDWPDAGASLQLATSPATAAAAE